jgi:hypothetical protein
MKEIIKIKEKEYTLNSNAYNIIEYKNHFKRSMANDVTKLINVTNQLVGNISVLLEAINEGKEVNVNHNLKKWEMFIEKLIPITWILIDENERPSLKEFTKYIDDVKIGDEWLISVIKILTLSILFPRIDGL